MRLFRNITLASLVQICIAISAFGQSSYKAESMGAAPADVPAALQAVLDAPGVRVASDQGSVLCEVWLRKTLPSSANPNTSSDVLYGSLPEGAFIGVLHFPSPTPDYRSQTIKTGFYTLRYALIPQDGNHVGVNPNRDALVMIPVSADKDPDKVLSFEDEVKLSQQASGTPHPGFLVGAPVNGSTFPSVAKDDSGHWNLQLKGRAKSGDLPLAFTVVGHWEG